MYNLLSVHVVLHMIVHLIIHIQSQTMNYFIYSEQNMFLYIRHISDISIQYIKPFEIY